ncbi:membrane-associated phospholipid phosphatase [Kitasatospora sp. MAP12-15]|uniref:phosphatase PAP2 family protein n=1 Tax=unclassified Kitasatospora TaxID=2633591 RepID=UPI0024761E44|nr:phosphatase PAP2 family protein [Kitasatospora sp. MAP12-44]MDH6111085.1 membrane-associated phospholipid phosphatase [Kitasatospora sp. MAP12-44]
MTSLFHSARPTADTPRSEAPHAAPRSTDWRTHLSAVRAKAQYLRLLAWPIYLVALWRYVNDNGLPYNNDLVFVWLIGALIAAAVHSGNRFGWLRVLRDWVPVMAAVWAYSLLRGYGSHTPWAVHWAPQVAFDKVVGGGQVWTVRLQHLLYTPGHLHWYDYLATTVYMSHFFAVFVVMAVLWRKRHERFTRLVALYLALTFAAFATYVLYPADPPWLTAQNGHLPAIARIVQDVLNQSGLPRAGSLFENGSRFDNDVAAMPSLHAAYPMLLALFFWPVSNRWVRIVLVAYPLAMAFTLVYGGEHFVVDILAGWTYTAVIYFGLTRLLDRRARLRAERKAAQRPEDQDDQVTRPAKARI